MRPTILVVEDRVPIRDRLARQFQEAGARVLPAATAEDALRLYKRQAFEIAALVTDIRLEDESEVDISGIELAKQIAEIDAGLPKFGVTAFDPSVGRGVLEKVFSKTIGGSDDPLSIYRHIPEIVGRAVGYEEGRFRDVPKDLLALKEKYRISSQDFEKLISSWRVVDLGRLALLAWHDVQEEPPEPASVASRRIQFLPVGSEIGGLPPLRTDLAVVTRDLETGAIAELYGMPLIYAYAETSAAAVAELVEHLHECHVTMGRPEDFSGPNVLDVIRFRTFLDRLFESEGAGG